MDLNYKIIYRPHPYSRIHEKDHIKITRLSHLVVDKPKEFENNTYRLSLIINSTAVIALYSTVVLEASILSKPCIIPSFIDANLAYKTSDFIDMAEHCIGTSALGGISNPETIFEFRKILNFYSTCEPVIQNCSDLLNWFCLDTNTNNAIVNLITYASSKD